MELTTESWGGARMVVPDNPTVLQIITYDSKQYELSGEPALLMLWEMAKTMIAEWECEAMPDINADLGELDDPRIARVIQWASNLVANHRRSLDNIPKN
jgi:hypothetical protein